MFKVICATSTLFIAITSLAGQNIDYKIGSQSFEGYLATPPRPKAKSPAVLIVPDWMGPSDYTAKKADEMAAKGYVALVVDIYGKGVRPKDGKEAGALAGGLKKDVKTLRERITAADKLLLAQKGVDAAHVVAFGYCFGGTSVLELGRSGATLAGLATFHGGLATPNVADAQNIKGRVLVMHGGLDPYVPAPEVETFVKEMNDAKVDYEFHIYGGAVHSFTIPTAGSDLASGAAYNPVAAKRAWTDFEAFLKEVAPAI